MCAVSFVMKVGITAWLLFVCVLSFGNSAAVADDSLTPGFYNRSCPDAEKIVQATVFRGFRRFRSLTAGLLRIYFHDCFVEGCDASILLDSTLSGGRTEKQSSVNGDTLHGLEVIDAIKRKLEAECPGIVSCADILTFAVRDAVVLSGLPFYEVTSGRRDGRNSLASNIPINLPSPFSGVDSQAARFRRKGFDLEEMVTLAGAHSVGVSHCRHFDARFYDEKTASKSPSTDIFYANYLRMRCPRDGSLMARIANKKRVTVELTPSSRSRLGVSYYRQLLRGRGLLVSDQVLARDPRTRGTVVEFAVNPGVWQAKFIKAMQKLGTVGVLVGDEGEVRKSCRSFNT